MKGTQMTINTAKALYDEISKDFKINNRTRRVDDIPEITVLRLYDNWTKVEFSISWYDVFIVSFNPKTVGVKYTYTNKATKESKTLSKQFPLDKENLLDTILDLYAKK